MVLFLYISYVTNKILYAVSCISVMLVLPSFSNKSSLSHVSIHFVFIFSYLKEETFNQNEMSFLKCLYLFHASHLTIVAFCAVQSYFKINFKVDFVSDDSVR